MSGIVADVTAAAPRTRVPREPIEQAALDLLEHGGPAAVTTRAVSAAAGVQAVAIYRAYGDMDGLVEAAVDRGFAQYLRAKTDRVRHEDPVEDLRQGWDLHVGFGLAHPHVYAMMYGRPDTRPPGRAAHHAHDILLGLVDAVARAGRLTTDVPSAARAVHASGRGVTLTLIEAAEPQRDRQLSHRVRECLLATLTRDGAHRSPGPTRLRATYAAALAATADEGPAALTDAELALLKEWLARLADDA